MKTGGQERGQQRGQGPGRGLLLSVAAAVMVLVALTIAPLALTIGAVWFLWRFLSYTTATVVDADIIKWREQRQTDHPSAVIAYAQLHFVDTRGQHQFVESSMGIPTDQAAPAPAPLPEGPIRLRYRRWPFLALEDDRSVWFAGPIILLGAAVLGTMLKVLFRFSPLAWVMGT